MTKEKTVEAVVVSRPNFQTIEFEIEGTAPYVQKKFSSGAKDEMLEAQTTKMSGTKGGKKKTKRDIEKEYQDSMHVGDDGEYGIPAAAFRNAMIRACTTVGYKMTEAKMSVFIVGDTVDEDEGMPLVHIKGEPKMHQSVVRINNTTSYVAIRAMWKTWKAKVRIQWDGDQFGKNDIANLLARAGMQVGIGEGRPSSKMSAGVGWGTFKLV